MRQLVNRALEDAEAQIQANEPQIFDRCDRLRSEGELRRGVSLPLSLVLCSIVALYTFNLYLILAVGIPGIFVYFSGMKKEEDGARLIVSCVNTGLASIQFEPTEKGLLEWSTSEAPKDKKRSIIMDAARTYLRGHRRGRVSVDLDPAPDATKQVS
jgi:hypothetical protein